MLIGSVGADEAVPKAESPSAPTKPARIEDFAPPEEFVTVGAVKTHFVHKGETGRVVVLVHGFGSSTATWNETIEALSSRYRVYAFDLKGFGLTAKPKDGQYHMVAYTEHLLGFLDVMKLDRPVVVGHSLGGAVVARVALTHPERMGGIVLVDPAPVAMPRDKNELMKRGGVDVSKPLSAADRAAKLNPALASRLMPTLLRSTITRQTVEAGLKVAYHDPKLVTPELIERIYRPLTIDGATEALASMINAPPPVAGPPLPALSSLKIPALVAWGGHDQVVPAALFDQYAREIPGAEKTVFANSGHIPQEEEPCAFNARLLEFLDKLP